MEIKATKLFKWNMEGFEDPNIDTVMNQGGSSSGKSWGILQCLVVIALQNPGWMISVVSHSLPHLKAGVMRDFFMMLESMGYYHESLHNKSNHSYKFPNGSTIEFFPASMRARVTGPRRHVLYVNECNLIEKEVYYQMQFRTNKKVFIDFNPSEDLDWIDKEIKSSEHTKFIQSTYKDNDRLDPSIIRKLEDLIKVDDNMYRVYVLGMAPIARTRIYTHFKTYTETPKDAVNTYYGLDFGFNHPTALVRVMETADGSAYVEELIYSSGLTVSDLVEEMLKIPELKSGRIFCDSARPEIIEELRRKGFNTQGSDKEVKKGIDTVKSTMIYLNEASVNLLKEYRLYSWKTQGDRILDEPVKLFDDGMDAMRYAIHSTKKNPPVNYKNLFRTGRGR